MMELAFPLTDHLVGSAFSLPSIFQIDCRSHAIIWAFQFLLTVADNSYAFCIQQPLIPFFFLKVCLCSVLCGFRNYGTASRALSDSKRNIARACEGAKALLEQWVYHPSPTSSLSPLIIASQCCQFPPYNEVQRYVYTYIPFLLVLTSSSSFHPRRSSEYQVELPEYTAGSYELSALRVVVYMPGERGRLSSCIWNLGFFPHLDILASVSCLLCFSPLLPTHCGFSILQYIWLFLLLSCKGRHIVLISLLERLLLVQVFS